MINRLVMVAIFLVLVTLTWVMHRAASRALDRHLPSMEPDNA